MIRFRRYQTTSFTRYAAAGVWLLVAGLAKPQSAVTAPGLGYIYDQQLGAVQPVLGIPGAALLGSPVDTGLKPQLAAISPAGGHGLVVSAEDGRVVAVNFAASPLSHRVLNDSPPAPDAMVLSPSGDSAVLLYKETGIVQVLTGLPDAPAVARSIPFPAELKDVVSAVVSDAGKAVLLVSGSGGSSPVVSVTGKDGWAIVPVRSAIAAVFQAHSQNAAIVTDEHELWLAQLEGTPQSRLLASDLAIADRSESVAFSRDGKRVFVAGGAAQSVAVIDAASGSAESVFCDCTPAGLVAMTGNALFRIEEPSATRVLLLEVNPAQSRFVVVPPDRLSDL